MTHSLKHGRSVVHRIVLRHHGKIQYRRAHIHGATEQVVSNDHQCDASRADVFLSTRVNYRELKRELCLSFRERFFLFNIKFYIKYIVNAKQKTFFFSLTLDTSKGFVSMLDDMSATSGTPFVSGMKSNSIPAKHIYAYYIFHHDDKVI